MAVVGGSPYKSNVRERVQKSGLEGKEVDRVRAVNPEVAEHEFAVGETRPVDLLNANPHFAALVPFGAVRGWPGTGSTAHRSGSS